MIRIFALISVYSAAFAFAETSTLHAVLPAVHASIGILNGRRTSTFDNPIKNSVVRLRSTKEISSVSGCTGLVVEGCVLTAGHCTEGDITVRTGEDTETEGAYTTIGGYIKDKKVLGNKGSFDLAVLKPLHPFPESVSQPRSILNDKRITLERGVTRLRAIGYGISEAREERQPDGSHKMKPYGFGVQRYGDLTYAGPNYEPGLIDVDRSNSSQMIAAGDSGGPVFFQQPDGSYTCVGINATNHKPPLEGVSREDLSAADVSTGQFVEIGSKRDWILQQLDELGCGTTPTQNNQTLAGFLAAEFPDLRLAQAQIHDSKWKSGEKFEQLRTHLVDYLKEKGKLGGLFQTAEFRDVTFNPTNRTVEITYIGMAATNEEESNRILARRGGSFVVPFGTVTIDLP